jgi:hypothetical protein
MPPVRAELDRTKPIDSQRSDDREAVATAATRLTSTTLSV